MQSPAAFAATLETGGLANTSVAVTVKANEPASAGVPASCPPAASVRPGGAAPTVTANVSGGVPALAESVWPYGTPATAPGSVAGESRIAVEVMLTEPPAPGATATGALSQSRAVTDVTVTAPAPSTPADLRSTLKTVPPFVMPQGAPSATWS